MIQEFAAEEFASKMFSLHKSAIFYHSYFVRVKLDPFCEREQTFIGKLGRCSSSKWYILK